MSDKKKGGIKRRDFLKIIGVAGGTAVATGGCNSDSVDQIIPYVIPPDDVIPGIPKWYASTCTECPVGCGILIKNREGRAIKVEGNPKSPVNGGALCAMGHASLQGLYNPDRVRSALTKNSSNKFEPINWDKAEKKLADKIAELKSQGKGDKIVFLSNDVTGSLSKLIDKWLGAIGGTTTTNTTINESEGLTEQDITQQALTGKHVMYDTFAHEPIKEANRISFGLAKIPTYNLEKARYILSFGADFLETWLSPTEYTAKFSDSHSFKDGSMGKLVQVEARSGLTGVNADEWIAIRPGTEGFLALGIASVILSEGLGSAPADAGALTGLLGNYTPETVSSMTDVPAGKIREIAREFASAQPAIAIGGGTAATATNATDTLVAINILNYVAGNIGETVDFGKSLGLSNSASFKDIQALVESMRNGEVELLFVYNVNPVFTLPKSLKVEEAFAKVPMIVNLSSHMDETMEVSTLVLPDTTNMEKWGDYIPRDGVYGLIQPAMNPVNLFNTKAAGDVILSVSKQVDTLKDQFAWKSFYEYLRDTWKNEVQPSVGDGRDFEEFWKESLENGGIYRQTNSVQVSLSGDLSGVIFPEPKFEGDGDTYLIAYPSARYHDGRGANKPWLQELPDPITTAVWDTWVEIHPDTASKLGVVEGDFIEIRSPYGAIQTQAFIYKGVRKDAVAVPIGLGHKSYGRYAKDIGVNPIEILAPATDEKSGGLAWLGTKVKISNTGKHKKFVKTQQTFSQMGRGIAQAVTVAELANGGGHNGLHEEKGNGHHGDEYGMYEPHHHINYRWGMSIDLSKCTGCGACVTACYAENNIAIVGKEQVMRGRYMGWLRIERFFEDNADGSFETRFLPMLCQHCDNAPCEPVCPVYATYHNHEGLNVMVYNRCVGTRYCSNNCTYKVRRFNWFMYKWAEPLNWQLNPDVTVRSVGVMEKCTFCSQRIVEAKDHAKDEKRKVRDGEFTTACAQTCASKAIVFGNIMDKSSMVSQISADKRGYHVLNEINTKPSITYLKKVNRDKA